MVKAAGVRRNELGSVVVIRIATIGQGLWPCEV